MRAYRAALFDFFGTLTHAVRRGPSHSEIARLLGCDPAEFVLALDRTFFLRASGALGGERESLRWLCDRLGARPSSHALARASVARVAAVRADTKLRADAAPTLRELRRRGLPTGVVSDCGPELPAFLPELPIAPYLDTAVFSVDIGECKPHPRMYLSACRHLAVDPEECLYVGDGGSQELTGAADVGMTAVRLAAPDLDRHLSFHPEPHWTGPTVGSLAEVVRLIDQVPVLV